MQSTKSRRTAFGIAAAATSVAAVGVTAVASYGQVVPGTPAKDVHVGLDNDNASNTFIQPPGVTAKQHMDNTDVLFGRFNPGGKLPVSIARDVGQLPIYYNRKPTARRGYLFGDVSPLYPFGYGLSYTSFDIAAPVLGSSTIGISESVKVSVDVTNTGSRAGDEVVQLYVRDDEASVTRPVTLGATQRNSASLSNIASGSNHLPSYKMRPSLRPSVAYSSSVFSLWIADSRRS